MYQKTVAALSERVAPHVALGNDRRETLGQLTLGLVSARTANLSVLAGERVAAASTASTYRRYQRFFQHADPGQDWAAPVVAALGGLAGPRTLILDRTNWKVGRQEINLLVLAVKTRRSRLGLMWTVLGRAGNSGAAERIALIERYIALFGQDSIGLLLGDREFIGTDWLNYLIGKDIPYVMRLREGQRALSAEGRSAGLGKLLLGPGGKRAATVTLDAMARKGVPGPAIAVRAVQPKGRKPVIVATNRPNLRALEASAHSRPPRTRGLPQALGHRELLRRRQDPRLQLRGHPPHRPAQARAPHRHPRHRHRLGQRHRHSPPPTPRPAAKEARLPRQILLPHRCRTPPTTTQSRIPRRPKTMGNPQSRVV